MSRLSPVARLGEAIQGILARRWVRLGLQLGLVAVSGLYLANSLRGASGTLAGLRVNYLWLGAAWALTVLTVFAGALAWWLVLRGLGQTVSWPQAARAHLFSNLAKYLPGYAWQLVGKAYLTKQLGVPARTVGVGMLIEAAQLVLIGLGVAFSLFPEALLSQWQGGGGEALAVVVRPAGIVIIVAVGAAGFWVRAAAGRLWNVEDLHVRPLALLSAAATILAGWLSFGLSFWLIGTALQPMPASALPLFTFALAVSLLISLGVVIIPGGIGVRESAMVWLLTPYVMAPMAVLIAALSRITLLLSEFCAALLFDGVLRLCNKLASLPANVQRKPVIPDQ